MAEWTATYINDLPDSAFACIDPGGKKDEQGKTVPRSLRHYPHHDANGAVDEPHLRNALSRVAQEDTTTCGVTHLHSHAEKMGMAQKAQLLDTDEMAAWFAGSIPRALLAIPFGGPITRKSAPLGADLQGEWFSAKTDIKPDWFSERPVLWHHGLDPTGKMGTEVIGKSTNLRLEEDGWWVDLWLKAGERRVGLVKALTEKGAQIFGSSQSIPALVKYGKAGHIDMWPYIEQTLSTTPVNTYSRFRAAKAVLADFTTADIALAPALRDVLGALDDLRDLAPTFGSSEGPAKAVVGESGLPDPSRWLAAIDRLRSSIPH